MNTVPLTTRLLALATALVATLASFSIVIAQAKPQRSVLIARLQHGEATHASARLALASFDAARPAR